MTQRAKFESRTAWCGSTFGEQYARRTFGDAVVDSLPRITRGKNAGKIAADIAWIKCTEGGWVSGGRDAMREEAVGRVENKVGRVVFVLLRDRDGNALTSSGDERYLPLLGS